MRVISTAVRAFRAIQLVQRWVLENPANQTCRGRRLAGAYVFQLTSRAFGRRKIVPIGGHSRMWADAHHAASFKAYCGNPPDWCQMMVWRRRLSPGDLFIDIGANVGTYTLWASDLGVEVVAIEPDTDARAHLAENLALNQSRNVRVLALAVGAKPGTMRLTSGRDVGNHLILDGDEPLSQEVAVDTLDNIIGDRVAAGVKVDVEGAEALILSGAQRALEERRIGCIQLEWSEANAQGLLGQGLQPLTDILTEHGYRLHRADERGGLHPADDLTGARDVFAIPK